MLEMTLVVHGTVKIVGQGDIEALKSLRKIALNGSDKSSVREIEEVLDNISEFSFDSFEIR